jgi:hypothetical protein
MTDALSARYLHLQKMSQNAKGPSKKHCADLKTGPTGWEICKVAQPFYHYEFGIGEDGRYFEQLRDQGTLGMTFRRQAYLDATRHLHLLDTQTAVDEPDHGDPDFGGWQSDGGGVVFEEEHRSRPTAWASQLFESERDVQAIKVLSKSSEDGSITFVVPHHVDEADASLAKVGPEATEIIFPGVQANFMADDKAIPGCMLAA